MFYSTLMFALVWIHQIRLDRETKRKTIINAIKLIFRNILLSGVQKRINIVNPICVSIRVCQVYTKEENPLRNIF